MSLVNGWVANWRRAPTAEVLVGPDGSGALQRLTASDVSTRSAAAAERLAAAGISPGDRVLVSAAPSVDLVIAHVALLRLGAVVVPANTSYTARELAHLREAARPVLAVADCADRFGDLPTARVDLHDLQPGGRGPAQPTRLDASRSEDPALIGFTSGTTGRPKGAVLTHGNLAAGAAAVVEAWGWSPSDRLVCALPLFHMHGLGVALHGTFTAGAAIRILPEFEPPAVAAAVAAEQATLFFGVPTMFARLAETGTLSSLSTLRLIVSGSAPLSVELFERTTAQAGQPPLERYGMTETVMLCSNPLVGDRLAGRVGRPLPGVEVRLGADGGVEVRGPNVFAGYLDDPAATAAAFTSDGWFRTGDLGEFDAAGSLRLVGRATELIITGGYNVYPREVEDVLRSHPAVRDVAVAGRPDPKWGEVVVAFVVAEPRAGLAAELGEVAETLAPFKRPRDWRFVADLPRNAMGKVRRDALVAQSAEAADL